MSSAKLLANCFRSSICFRAKTWIFQENKVNIAVHDDVIKWKHFPRYRSFVREIYRSPVSSPHKGQWRGAVMFSLICAWVNVWVNNGEACDLRRHRAHYDVTVMRISRHGIDITGYEGARVHVFHAGGFQRYADVIKWKHVLRYWPSVRESIGHWWIPLTKASDAELWRFLWSAFEQTVEQTIGTPVIWDAIAFIMTSL